MQQRRFFLYRSKEKWKSIRSIWWNAFEKQPEHKCIKKKNTHQTFYHKSRYRGNRYFPISDGPTYRYHDRLPYCQNAFSQASWQRCLEIYTKPVVRKNQESLFETFSKRSPPPSKNLSSLQKYIPNGSYLRYFYQTKQKQKFLVFLSILAIFLGFYGEREYLRPKYRGQR